ncbi:MAG: glutamine--fructose-6-phosphate transaminase (isomerizing) [Nanoarchaeota archaeon]
MCGIIGYVGKKEVVPLLIEGLKKLEYRGYDSCGFCVPKENSLITIKKKGRVIELEKEISESFNSTIGIAHTRWATHGEPNERNAHPHFDCNKNISIVHNGIIENFHVLKEMLEQENHVFKSETDSEVIAHLIEKFYNGDLEEATREALKLVEGTFGLAVLNNSERKIIASKRGSPLVIGVGDKEFFVTSDIAPIIEHTNKVIYLNDNEIAQISDENYSIRNLNGDKVNNSKIHDIKLKLEQIEKGNYKHFMLKEIFEQPESIANALRGRIKNESEVKLSIKLDLKNISRIILLGCGTSWHSALIGKHLIEKIVNIPVEVDYASEFRYRSPLLKESDLVVSISQSGERADTLAAIKEAKQKNIRTFGIINIVGSSIAREVDSGIYLHAGPEIGVASTKAFTSQIVNLLIFALYLKQTKTEINKQLNKIPEYIKEVLKTENTIKSIAEKFKDNRNFLYLGRGINFPAALEGALKLKEISYIHAEGYPAAEMKHGPIALVDENMPVVFIAPKDATYEKIISNMQEVKARKGRIIAIVNEADSIIKNLAEEIIIVPKVPEEISPIVNSIPLQLLAYHIANLKGLDVDKPRNLAKSVTVE